MYSRPKRVSGLAVAWGARGVHEAVAQVLVAAGRYPQPRRLNQSRRTVAGVYQVEAVIERPDIPLRHA